MRKIRYPSLNGLRAVSIILVIFHHLEYSYNIDRNLINIKWLTPFIDLIEDGPLGVNMFFVISGFLITSLLYEEELATAAISLKNFYTRRILRIFPAYYFLLFVYFILQLLGIISISNASWLTALTYTKYLNWPLDWYTGHAWSLSIEEQFYLFWPLIFIAGDKVRKIAAACLIIIVPVIRLYSFFHPAPWINDLTIFTRIDAIAVGCLFALYKEKIILILSNHWNKLFYFSVIILLFLRYLPTVPYKIHLATFYIPLGLTHGTFASILIALIMMYSIFGPHGVWFKILNSKVLNYIGVLSYSIYLWQQIFIMNTTYWFNQYPFNLVLILIAALFSYYLIERPFLKLKSKFN
jgi:peptidoglycan/LPS O-acetylase OafA/YrhL